MCEILASATGLPFARPTDLVAATPDAAAHRAGRAVPRRARAAPAARLWGALVVAMADPFDEAARAELEFATGRSLRVELCTEEAVLAAIALHHRPCSEDNPSFLYDDDLSDLFAAACADEADILEIADEDLIEEPPARGN